MDLDAFVARFGHAYEDSPSLAASVWSGGPYPDDAALLAAFESVVTTLTDAEVLALLRAHPQLGARAPMGASSTAEQQGAGLVAADPVVDRIRAGNEAYLERFGFPFIIAVKGLGPGDIAAALERRLGNDEATERAEALRQVQRIARLRVEAVLAADAGAGVATPGGPTVDGARLLRRLDELATIGATASGGVTREAFGPEDVAARTLVAEWMREAGLEVHVDAATNLVGRSGPGPWLATGSHLDTVVDAGPLDGAYGVVAGVEVAAALGAGVLVVAFANEEGARGTDGMVGSRALVGPISGEELAAADDEGVTLAARIAAAGGDPERLDAARWDPADVRAFVELHVEQGPVLDSTGDDLGVVTAITGRVAVDIDIAGAANHAGTTPMHLRRDALAAAAEVVLAVERLALDGAVRVATCGRIEAAPGVRNVVPGHVRVSAELRDTDPAKLAAVRPLLEAAVATTRDVAVTVTWGQLVPPVAVDPAVQQAVEAAAKASGRPWASLPSGAGHDAQILAPHVPTGMIFVPSIGGISHAPTERTDPEHLVAGAQLLLDTFVELSS